MDRRLADKPYLAGDDYSIADVTCCCGSMHMNAEALTFRTTKTFCAGSKKLARSPRCRKAATCCRICVPTARRCETLKNYFGDVQYEKR